MLSLILKNRAFLMGIAMLMVLIYHFFCWVWNPIGRLNIGFVGVDVFLFLSGLGLSYSYEKNSLIKFYINRFKRIYPIYFVAVSLTYCLLKWNPVDLLYNYLTVGFYTKGGYYRYDWYLESLFTLYLLFPLFYKFAKQRYYALSVCFLFVATILIVYKDFFDVNWWYNCFFARIPIFLYGIMFKNCTKSIKAFGYLGGLFFIPCLYISPFLGTSMLVIPIIIISLRMLKHINSLIKLGVNFIGAYSLEIYCANCLMHKFLDIYYCSVLQEIVIFILLQVVFSLMFIGISIIVKRFMI